MTLPENFSPWEHLQNTLIQTHNRIVREEFRDVGDDNWEESITTPRSSLRVACTIKDDDSALMTHLRMWLFYVILRKASDLSPAIYGIPCTSFQEVVRFRPQVRLFFLEDADEVEAGYPPIDAEISIRLMDETSETFTPAKANALATKISNLFGVGNGFVWRKGRIRARYYDSVKGHDYRINAINEQEAKRVLEQVLDVTNDGLDSTKLRFSQPDVTPPIVPPVDFIYGQSRRLPRKFPVGNVRFRHAEVHLWGMPNPVVLVSTTPRRRAIINI